MKADQITCNKCGKPFISQKMFRHISSIAREHNLEKYEGCFELCPSCRTPAFIAGLLGNDLKIVAGAKHVTKRSHREIETVTQGPETGVTVYRSQCYICNSGCDAVVHVKDGRVVKIEGYAGSPVTKGVLCAKGLASRHMLYNSERLKYPMKRAGKKGEGKWQRISWDEALTTIAHRAKETEAKYGKYSFALTVGTMRGWDGLFQRFSNAIRRQRTGPGIAQCALPRRTASSLVTGGIAMECPDYDATECMIVWAANPPATWPVKALGMMEAKSRGARLIVIDPVLSETAAKADLWLRIRPGTDAALALGMLNVIINEELYDKQFVAKWCQGFPELAQRVREYPPEKVAQITWIPAAKIIEAARTYASTKPACITQCVAIDQNADTISTSRAIAMLASITGNIDIPGGNVFPMPTGIRPGREASLVDNKSEEDFASILGSAEYPLLAGKAAIETGTNPSSHNGTLWTAILTAKPYPVRALYCHGNNMTVAYGNSARVAEALRSLDFLAVCDLFMTPTGEMADILLPASTWLERNAVGAWFQTSYSHVHLQQKTVEFEDCWSDYKILNELAKRFGVGDLMFDTEEEYCNYMLAGTGLTFAEFRQRGMISIPFAYRKYEEKGFATPSGKIELYSRKLKGMGFDPLPAYREPTESPFSTPELAKDYPLVLTTGAREPVYRHAELRNVPELRQIWPEPGMKINPKTAEVLGIREGDTVIVETLRGSMEMKAWLREDIDPRVVQVPTHWPGKNNANLLIHIENCAPIVGSTQLRCQLCRVRRAD